MPVTTPVLVSAALHSSASIPGDREVGQFGFTSLIDQDIRRFYIPVHDTLLVGVHKGLGKWQWVLDRGRTISQDNNGKPTRMVGTHVDITERRMIEVALRQSEEKFRQLADNMREVFWQRERESGKFIYISPAFSEIWGRSTESIYKDSNVIVESMHWEDFSHIYHSLKELVGNGIIFN